uniref:C-type lectin domain-containing protein n=1 Tax=Branchiostoma floridae TaxID=7739 RepID=C3ZPF6_BRAFL|eukprot:XP_002589642.1 hypothetical protein BRAFLDRAFT_99249 [Branchiostoma floridae]
MEKKLLLCLVLLAIPVATAQDCAAGYQEIDGSCYYFSKVAKNSRQAIATCEASGGELLEVDDDATRAIIDNYASRCVGDDIVEQEGLDAWLKGKVDNSCAIRASYAITKSEWPAFRDLKGNYPPPALTWDNIVDREGLDAWLKNLANKNTCAMRVSYAITKSGMTMEVPDECRENWAGVRDRNRNPYFIRVATMCCYLQETIGAPAITGKNQADYAGHQGIIVFKDCDFETATGHVDLWDGADCCGQCYFDKCKDISLYKCE